MKLFDGVFGVDAELERVAAQVDVLLAVPQRTAGGHEQLLAHEVEPGHHLGHRVLHLQPRVHLDERGLVGLRVVEELHGSEPLEVALPGQFHRRAADALAHVVRKVGRRCLLHDLLLASLHGAVAVTQVDGVDAVSEDLHLHVAGVLHEALEVHVGAAECGLRLGLRDAHGGEQVVLGLDEADAPTPASGRRLHQHAGSRWWPPRR